ncbi:hypothetical protein A1O3_04432 [Capronia epimyces CBS 606.96]|uniref:Zn(2)-C6 fungal-type domain-containing protein n=1 Tax=Capronia epimyces CBS 606.96 TaxID=1182542 RepID=W9Y3U1_9EURO|nr:uncharacterized protein A1O3_04432 [Capronia epimyces CBS 606.96]EXJ87472.1 hypothetical protein A1O3_04432 [Capronia epimyces CBS 606.96]
MEPTAGDNGSTVDQSAKRPRNTQSCLACRATKSRCIPVQGSDICEACTRRSRQCVKPGPVKQRIKTSQKISSLEEKIELLTRALSAKAQEHPDKTLPSTLSPEATTHDFIAVETSSHENCNRELASVVDKARERIGNVADCRDVLGQLDLHAHDRIDDRIFLDRLKGFIEGNPELAKSFRVLLDLDRSGPGIGPPPEYHSRSHISHVSHQQSAFGDHLAYDVVGRGLIDMPTAEVLLNHYNLTMRPILPLLTASHSSTAAGHRLATPVLFLALLAVTSAAILPSFTSRLVEELHEQLAREILVVGTPSMELIQAALLYSQYCMLPTGSHCPISTLHVSAAVTMACDLGLFNRATRLVAGEQSEGPMEAARMWLACWYAASSNATLLRQKLPVLPTSEVDSCLAVLSRNESHQPHLHDRWLCSIVRLQMILEDVSNILAPVSVGTSGQTFDEPAMQYKMSMLQRRVEDWKSTVPVGVDEALVKFHMNTARLCINHIAIRSYVRRPLNVHGEVEMSATHFNSLCSCVESIQGILETYISFPDSLARSLPNSYLSWTLYATVCMMKLGQFIDSSLTDREPSIAQLVDATIEKVARVSENGYLPQAKACEGAFRKLKLWYQHKRAICINAKGLQNCIGDGKGSIYSALGATSDPFSLEQASTVATSGIDATQTVLTPDINPHRQLLPPRTMAEEATEVAYDPSTYENTNWAEFTFDSDAMREFDAYMMDENEDESWLRSFVTGYQGADSVE